jgi:hypothetical protein
MDAPKPSTGIECRRDPRIELDGDVTIRIEASTLTGSGQNISQQGVYFLAEGPVPVTVCVAGRGEVRGRLVRVESRGDGQCGIAVRFDTPHPELLS